MIEGYYQYHMNVTPTRQDYIEMLQVSSMYIGASIVNNHISMFQVSKEDKVNMQNIKLMKTGFILLGFFLLCWLPFTISLSTALTFQIFHSKLYKQMIQPERPLASLCLGE